MTPFTACFDIQSAKCDGREGENDRRVGIHSMASGSSGDSPFPLQIGSPDFRCYSYVMLPTTTLSWLFVQVSRTEGLFWIDSDKLETQSMGSSGSARSGKARFWIRVAGGRARVHTDREWERLLWSSVLGSDGLGLAGAGLVGCVSSNLLSMFQ